MAIDGIATVTMVRIREISTNVFQKISRNILNIDFLQRTRKAFLLCLISWLVLIIVGVLSYGATINYQKDIFYQKGVKDVIDVATWSGPFVLEKDILALNVAIKDFRSIENIHNLVILDKRNIILSHKDPEMLSRKFVDFGPQEGLGNMGEVLVTKVVSYDSGQLIGFWKEIFFADVAIGKVYLTLPASNLDETLSGTRRLYLAGIILFTLLLIFILIIIYRSSKARTEKIKLDFESTERLGPYRLRKKLAQGGMAELFIADYLREDGFRKRVAIKRILPNFAENKDFVRMFSREARLAALLDHPNVVQIFDFGKLKGANFIAMEYVEGKNLGEILSMNKHGLSIEQAVFIISEICKGLAYSHNKKDDETGRALGIVHRDVSPQNILISYQGEVKISDFGVSKTRSDPGFTRAGVIKGKLAYISVEQTLGKPVDARADIYTLGLVLYEAITGRRVYSFSSDVEAIRTIPEMEIKPLVQVNPQVPEDLNSIVMKCLEKDLNKRYQTASNLYYDLSAFRKDYEKSFDASDLADFMNERFPK